MRLHFAALSSYAGIAGLALALVASQPAYASPVDSQSPNNTNGLISCTTCGYPYQVSDDFTLSAASSITSIEWWGAKFGGTPTSFTVSFYSDSNTGTPGNLLGSTVLTSYSQTLTGSAIAGTYPVYDYSGTISSLSLSGSTTYWVSIVANAGWVWDTSSTGNSQAYVTVAGGSNYFQGSGGNTAFVLDGTSVAATPEPSSLVLLGTGMAGLLGVARRRFSRAA